MRICCTISSEAQFKVLSATSGGTNLIWMLMSHSFSAKLWGNGTFVWCINLDGENTPPTRIAHCHAKLWLAYIVYKKNAAIRNCTKWPTAAPAGPWLAGAPRRGSGSPEPKFVISKWFCWQDRRHGDLFLIMCMCPGADALGKQFNWVNRAVTLRASMGPGRHVVPSKVRICRL